MTRMDAAPSLPSLPEDFVEDVLITGEGVDALLDAPTEIVMRYPNCVSEDTLLARVPEFFLSGNARVLVVVDGRQRPTGVITAAHVLRAAKFRTDLETVRVRDVATRCGSISDGATLRAAAQYFAGKDKHHLLIVNERGAVVGMLTAADVLNAIGAWAR